MTPMQMARRAAGRISWHTGGALEIARLHARRAAAQASLPVTQEFLHLGCATGNEASGMFSEFCAVLGALAHYEKWSTIYCGLRVDFGRDGLYYEATRGANWWQYYFQPVELGAAAAGRTRRVPPWQHDLFADHVERLMPRERAASLVARYIRIQPAVQDQVTQFTARHFRGEMLGIHYRGTDKHIEERPVPLGDVIAAARSQTSGHTGIFLATDDQNCLEQMRAAFGNALVFRDVQRSTDGSPVHKSAGDPYRAGEEAIVDCLLLSRCARLIRTPSDLSLASTFLNPDLIDTALTA